MKISQKIVNGIIIATLALFGYNEVEPMLSTATPHQAEAPELADQFVIDEAVETTWYCWLTYWVPSRQDCENFAPVNCKDYSLYAHSGRIKIVQARKPDERDFVGPNGLYIPAQLKNLPGVDTSKIELAGVYAVQVQAMSQNQNE